MASLTSNTSGPPAPARAARLTRLLCAAAAVLTALAVAGCGRVDPATCTRHATVSSLAGTFASARAGDVICLASGNYGTFSGGSKSGDVTLVPERGAAVTLAVWLRNTAHIRLDSMTIAGGYIQGSHDLAFTNDRFTAYTRVDTDLAGAERILFDSDTFDNINTAANTYEGRLSIRGYGNTSPVGVQISNSHFGAHGVSDGIQLTANTYGVRILHNEFDHIRQSDVPPGDQHHVDPLQLVGACHCDIEDNYFHDNSTAIMAPDGGNGEYVMGNVFVMDEYPDAVVAGSWTNSVLVHNTVTGGALRVDNGNARERGGGDWVFDNVATNLVSDPGNIVVEDWNLLPSGVGSGRHDLHGAPTFSGGSRPTAYAGFHLVAGTLGTHAANDGKNIGIP